MSDTLHDRIRAKVAEGRDGYTKEQPDPEAARVLTDRILDRHHEETVEADVPVEGGRAFVVEDVTYCAGCGALEGDCPDVLDLAEAWGVEP